MLFLLFLYKKRIIDKFCDSDITLRYSALKMCVNSYQFFLTGKVMKPCSIPKSSLQNSPSGGLFRTYIKPLNFYRNDLKITSDVNQDYKIIKNIKFIHFHMPVDCFWRGSVYVDNSGEGLFWKLHIKWNSL